ncbi:MAG: DUF1285 domain-containing protein [Motiliproteus sp.]|nr:DUF1285 domain-containing protein [Motiliproteus sp.]MCW9052948.1 DUF1285 domain-containing protein [Motiliproteus sp.]
MSGDEQQQRKTAEPQKLADQVKKASKKGLPPVHLWNPDFCGDIDIRIARNGEWFYQGSVFTRQSLVNLFSTVLRKDDEEYFLVTPVEKLRIQVDDAPFVITAIEQKQLKGTPVLCAETNTGDQITIDQAHPLWVVQDSDSGEPSPYVRVRDRLDGLIARSVYYQLIELAEERILDGKTCLGVESAGEFFVLGELDS